MNSSLLPRKSTFKRVVHILCGSLSYRLDTQNDSENYDVSFCPFTYNNRADGQLQAICSA